MRVQFFAQIGDQQKCKKSIVDRQPATLSGLSTKGDLQAFTGVVHSMETGQAFFRGYPLRVTMDE